MVLSVFPLHYSIISTETVLLSWSFHQTVVSGRAADFNDEFDD